MQNYTLIHLVYVGMLDIFRCLRCICWNVFQVASTLACDCVGKKVMKTLGYGRVIKNKIKGKKCKYNHACAGEVSRNSRVYTRSDNKVMRLAPKKPILFINYNQLHLYTNLFHPQFFSQYQMNGFPVHVHFISNHLDC